MSRIITLPHGAMLKYSTLNVAAIGDGIIQVELNRPEKRNAMNKAFWSDMRNCFHSLASDGDCRVILLTAVGPVFSAGLDLTDSDLDEGADTARTALQFQNMVKEMQESFTAIEKCPQPVIACVHGGCIGAGVDMISACDVRLCTEDAWFCVKEVDIGLAADLGTLQRMPKLIGNDSIMRELVYTARPFASKEARIIGFIGAIYKDHKELIAKAVKMAQIVASKSPVAVMGSKHNLIYSRDHPVPDALNYMATWNGAMLQTDDIMKVMEARAMKKLPAFSKL